MVAVKTQTTPTPNDTHIFLQHSEISSDSMIQGSVSQKAYAKLWHNALQKEFPTSNHVRAQNVIVPASIANTRALMKIIMIAFPKKTEYSRTGRDFIFCMALSAYSVWYRRQVPATINSTFNIAIFFQLASSKI